MTPLPDRFAARPFAHRGLHDDARGIIENSASAVRTAVVAGFAVEIDVQLTADGDAVVFHDDRLDRLTALRGPVRDRTSAELGRTALCGGPDVIVPLRRILALAGGRVPLLVEVKDQSGILGATDGRLEGAVASALQGYRGPVAVMSFNPESVRALRDLAPAIPRGLTTCPFAETDWPELSGHRRAHLAAVADYDGVGAAFVSHRHDDLAAPRLGELRDRGAAILCWTVRSPEEERAARALADAVTFEGYHPSVDRAG